MHRLIAKYERLKQKYPSIAEDLVTIFFERMEEEAYDALDEYAIKKEFGCHIGTEELYKQAVGLLRWVDDKGHGAKWTVEDIVKLSGIDFTAKKYTRYDYSYIVNMLYSDNCNIFTEPSYYLKMAQNYLTDPDYMGEADERAYHDAKCRIQYNQ